MSTSREQSLPATPAKTPLAERLLERFAALPRVGKWVVIAGIGAGGYLVFESVIWPTSEAFDNKANRYAAVLARAAMRAEGLPSSVVASAKAHGPNMAPELESVAKNKLAESITAIMKTHGASFGWSLRWNQLSGGVMPSVAAELGGTMARAIAEIDFEAAPETATRIIHDIDRDPAVDAVTDLKINYLDKTRRVKVTMTVERWGVQVSGGRR
ncbi:MAG: hypothetical protein GC172_07595 [Phycisphaera sp.]|nr:hypothetical protein [Phycisphaera sp.]